MIANANTKKNQYIDNFLLINFSNDDNLANSRNLVSYCSSISDVKNLTSSSNEPIVNSGSPGKDDMLSVGIFQYSSSLKDNSVMFALCRLSIKSLNNVSI